MGGHENGLEGWRKALIILAIILLIIVLLPIG